MNIAYLISAHNDPRQLLRLVEVLGDNAWCFIHIDQKNDIRPFMEAFKVICYAERFLGKAINSYRNS